MNIFLKAKNFLKILYNIYKLVLYFWTRNHRYHPRHLSFLPFGINLYYILKKEKQKLKIYNNKNINDYEKNLIKYDDINITNILNQNQFKKEWEELDSKFKSNNIFFGQHAVNQGDQRLIYNLIRYFKPKNILEIGTHTGASTIAISNAIQKNSNENYLISFEFDTVDIVDVNDKNSEHFKKFFNNNSPKDVLKKLNLDNIPNFIYKNSIDFFKHNKKKYDLVFLDGDHSSNTVYKEIINSLKHLNRNSLILLHDFYSNNEKIYLNLNIVPGPYLAFNKLVENNFKFRFCSFGNLPWKTMPNIMGKINFTSLCLLTSDEKSMTMNKKKSSHIYFKYIDLGKNGRFSHFLKDIEIFNKYNFYLTEKNEEADILFVTHDIRNEFKNFNDETKKFLYEFKKPIILLERSDSGVCFFREFDEIPNLVAVFKNRIIKNIEKNNIPVFKGRYHYNFTQDDYIKNFSIRKFLSYKTSKYDRNSIHQFPKIESENFKKVKAVIWDKHSSYLDDIVQSHKNYFYSSYEKKNIDVFCINRTLEKRGLFYFSRPYEHLIHRNKAYQVIQSLKNTFNVVTKTNNKKQYLEALRHSKIIVACWGYGEWVHLDGSAMMLGSVLVKPDSDYIFTPPDLYKKNKTYVATKENFSDLENVLTSVLKNYDNYNEMRKNNYKMISALNTEKIIKNFIDETLLSIKNFST